MNAHALLQQFARTLVNLAAWMDKAKAHAEARKFDPNVFVQARLAPDMYAFAQQVQAACDSAKFAAAYLSGTQAPAHPDTEKTLEELQARVRTCLAYLETFKASDFDAAASRKVAPRWAGGAWMTGEEYLLTSAVPNFYFHATTAYDILRSGGVELGKRDFIGTLPLKSA